MPLSATRLKDDVKSRLEAAPGVPFIDDALSDAVIAAVCAALIDELTTHGLVTVSAGATVSVDPNTGVGTVTGPSTGTIA